MSYIGTNKVGKMYLGGVAIGKAYLGSDLVYNSEGGIEPVVDTTLIAYWDGEDAPVSGNWVDRIGGKRLKLYGTYTRTNGYYQFLNTSSYSNYANLLDNDFDVDYEIKIVVEFELKPNSSNSMIVLDFCGYDDSSGSWGFGAARTTGNGWFINTKSSGSNSPLSEYKTGTYPTLTNDVWNACIMNIGVECDVNTDEQRAFLEIGEGRRQSIWIVKKKITAFSSGNGTKTPYFARSGSTGLKYYTNIRLKTIKVYNVASQSNGDDTPPVSLPYDAKVEYLVASGTQWIDTGVAGDQNIRARVKFMPTASGSMYVYGCRGDNSRSISVGSGSNFNWRFGNQTQLKATSANTVYDVVQDKNKIRVNGAETAYSTVSNFTTLDNIYLMWASLDTSSLYFQGRIYFMKILDGDTLVRDFIPVRVGQVGYMYDKVSGELFGNDGTGSFALGNDIS